MKAFPASAMQAQTAVPAAWGDAIHLPQSRQGPKNVDTTTDRVENNALKTMVIPDGPMFVRRPGKHWHGFFCEHLITGHKIGSTGSQRQTHADTPFIVSSKIRGMFFLTLKNPAVAWGQIALSQPRLCSHSVMPRAARAGMAASSQSRSGPCVT